ncbi:type II toxin-antitoxin system RelE/ParE family toxin [Aliarcobacter lanthieri]|uniref:type II toxin-antitoxin system RelE/ParE family toxin n=1 Tax=Aliarcobacter lanthieri TaxID=1355374 RepID=UPI001D171419|nr:type II toxin-antitoxin system RelE/ParE family toxin [Aliarcobacter lanthieri]
MRRIGRMKLGNFGDYKSIDNNIFELRITTSTAYRVYYTKKDEEIIILLIGGDKSTQSDNIKKANEILKELDNE